MVQGIDVDIYTMQYVNVAGNVTLALNTGIAEPKRFSNVVESYIIIFYDVVPCESLF
jgi:hypothetical protein